jgi:predicted MFS family arabinose efflux permease
VVNGFGRFAYALLLPVMRQDLAWDYTASGYLNTANSLGYGLGALAGWLLLAQGRARAAALFVGGLAGTVATVVCCAFTRDLGWMLLWRFASGMVSAWVFACGGALVAERYASHPARAGSAIAIFYAGGGLGIAASSLLIFPVLGGHWAWPSGWLALGVAGLALSVAPAWLAAGAKNAQNTGKFNPDSIAENHYPITENMPIIIAYFLFGVGYIVYLTFVIAWLRDMRLDVGATVGLWLLLGLAVMASGYLWRGVMARWWPPHTFAAATLCTAVGTGLPLLSPAMPVLLMSVCLVGASFFMAPGAMMALARATLPQAQWAKAMSLFTFIFAVGQGIGPVAAGWVADRWSLNHAMLAGVCTLGVAVALALQQPRPVSSPPGPSLSK